MWFIGHVLASSKDLSNVHVTVNALFALGACSGRTRRTGQMAHFVDQDTARRIA